MKEKRRLGRGVVVVVNFILLSPSPTSLTCPKRRNSCWESIVFFCRL